MATYRGTVRRTDVEGGGLELHTDDGATYELDGGGSAIRDGARVEIDGSVSSSLSLGMRGEVLRVKKVRAI